MHLFILSDLVKSSLALGLTRARDPPPVPVEVYQTVFREASEENRPSAHELQYVPLDQPTPKTVISQYITKCLLCTSVKAFVRPAVILNV